MSAFRNGVRGFGWVVAAALLQAGAALAAPYWVAWEGNDYPENEDWVRITDGVAPAQRTLADGIMTIDSLVDTQIDDYYRLGRLINPAPGEVFVAQWRIRVHEVVGNPLGLYDPGVAIFSDDDWTVSLLFGSDSVRSLHERQNVPIESGGFHAFEFRSFDMRTYELHVDGSHLLTGSFWEPTFEKSKVEWGDRARGSASKVEWDYFRFGVVPEPASIGVLLLVGVVLGRNKRLLG